jgi:hypothetical protein
MEEGWIKLHRSIIKWEWYDDVPTKVLFIHLLITANHADANYRGKKILRGQKWTSMAHLSVETGLTIKQVRVAIEKMKTTGEIDIQGASDGTMITVCKYDSYQEVSKPKGEQRASQGQAEGQSKGDKQEEKEKKEEEKQKEEKEIEISEEEIFPQNPISQLNDLLNIQTKNQPPIAQPPLLFQSTEESPKTSTKPPKVKKLTPYVDPQDDFHEDPELNKALQMFAQDRKDRRKPMTFNAMKLNLDKLEEFSTEQLTKALYESISNGYMGVFPRKEQQNNTNIGAAHKLPEKMNYQGNM